MPVDVGAQQRDAQKFIIFSQFEKMNTKVARQSLPENQAAWMENLQPVAPNNLVPTPGALAALTSISGIVQSLFSANIGAVDYIIAFTTAGAGIGINAGTGAQTTFAPAGTFTNPDMTVFASGRLLIQDPTAGYSTWDGTLFVTGGGVSPKIIVTNGGSLYAVAPTVAISGGSGSGATATAVMAGQSVVGVKLTAAGSGYKAGDTLTVAFTPVSGGSGAAATAVIWPIQFGTTIAVFAGRVWWGNGRVLQFTGTAGYDDTDPGNAAGAITITDADLSHSITAVRTLNNYLYIFGDSSVRQIGSISVSSNITLFTPLILASDIGTPFPKTILSYNRLVLFANKIGVYAIFGASVEKISDDLDGIFGGLNSTGSSIDFSLTPSAALNDIRNIHCYLLLVRYIDPLMGLRSIILAFQEKVWFVISQGNGLTAITSAELNSTKTVETFGSSGNDVTQLLEDPTVSVSITLQTSLTPHGNPLQAKQPLRAGIGLNIQGVSNSLVLSIDTENGSLSYNFSNVALVKWVNNLGQEIIWLNNSGQVVSWAGSGYRFPYTSVDGNGKMLGATLTAIIANHVINQIAIEYQERALWG